MADGREVVPDAAKGWGMIFTYLYIVYLAVLLIHRDGRDEDKCAKKYGKAWKEYTRIVKWRIVPGIY
jgi:Delta14-sterol reductase